MTSQQEFPPLPAHLAQARAQGLIENEPVAQYELGAHRNFIYLILDWSTRQAAIVDPQEDLAPIFAALTKHRYTLASILLTHSHPDHTAGVPELLQRLPNVSLRIHAADIHRLPKNVQHDPRLKPVHDHEKFQVGSLEVQAFHTPGHSAGESSYWLKAGHGYLFTGDTVFIRDCGRTDFSDGSDEQMFASLSKIKRLPGDTILMVGHHYRDECATTLARELVESPPFRCASVDELAALP